jgi:aminoglycoside adenylyltransferase-like protein
LLELDVVVAPALRPWRYPPPLDFHYSESFLEGFERGDAEPWRVDEHGDLAASVTVLRHGGVVLAGAPVADVFPDVPLADYRRSIAADLDWCLEQVADRKLYVVLSLPRIWSGLETEDVHSKVSAAAWALAHLPPELRPVLEHGLAVYRGEAEQSWSDLPVGEYVSYLVARIRDR